MKVMILWIVAMVAHSVMGQNGVDQFVKDLSKSLSKAFDDLKVFMNADDLSKKIKTTSKPLTDDVAIGILTKSKADTEALVSQTSSVVDNIQSKITEDFKNYAETPAAQNNIECSLTNYMFYFRSKAIRNGLYELQNCTAQNMSFSNDYFLENIKSNRINSTVHVPTNVYDSSREIQNVANYTQYVDEIFAVSEKMPQIKWQFFCSNTGFFKIFPGIKWHIQIEDMEKDYTKVDFYDCRSEQWFLESTSYPKKMMIMVDKSGSMKGRRRIIANHTIYEILNTITENDYFNLGLFTKDFLFADNKTTDILMQATEKNKRYIMDQLDIKFVPDGIAEYDIGLKASFKVLQNERYMENSSIIYNYLLMIITDGSPFHYQDVIESENKDVNARIFTYLIGQASTEREVVKHMACNNRGYAVEIATLADVKENVQKYLNVVARPNAIMQNAFHVWTGVHQYQMRPSVDHAAYSVSLVSSNQMSMPIIQYTTNYSLTTASPGFTTSFQTNFNVTTFSEKSKIEITKHETIKMFVTVSKAAYDSTNDTAQKNIGNLLGAAGVDVPISDFTKTIPFWKIGVNSYYFGVTHNGFVIFHPRFRPQDKKFIKYFYRNVDISEVEVSTDDIINEIHPNQTVPSSLRDSIITILPEHSPQFVETRATYDIIDDYKTAFRIERRYFITGIKGTPYKFGLAVPLNQTVPEYPTGVDYEKMDLSVFSENFMSNVSDCNASTTLANEGGLALKRHELCHLNQYLAELFLQNPLCALKAVIVNSTTRSVCLTVPDGKNISDDILDQYLKSLYNEADDTKHLAAEWSKKAAAAESVGVQQIFSMHHFGLIRYYNYQNLSYEQFISHHNAASEDPYYQETILTSQALKNPGVLVARPLPNDVVKKVSDKDMLIFTVTTPIFGSLHYKGVVGVQASHQRYSRVLMDLPCTSANCFSCNDTYMFDCYVVTGSGLVVLNNLPIPPNTPNTPNTGESLKEIDCSLMESLVGAGVFIGQSLYDFQGLCLNIPKTESFANMLIDPFTSMFRLSMWLIYELLILVQNISWTSLLWTFTFQEEIEQFPELTKPPLEGSGMKLSVFSTESVINPIMNIDSNIRGDDAGNGPITKSKRQHELYVKSTLEEKLSGCKKSSQSGESDFSTCVQKGITDICKLDGKQSDHHVSKLTSLNTISHCITVCLILQSDYPNLWQEQDDCRQPNYMCRTVTPAYTTMISSSKLPHPNPFQRKLTPTESNPLSYFQYQQAIVSNEDTMPTSSPSPTITVLNGTVCAAVCPSKTWYATGIENTNLILIVVHKQNAACSCECNSSFGLKVEIKRNLSNPIENPIVQQPPYFSQFVALTKMENSSDCSDDSTQSVAPLKWMVTVLALLIVFMMH